MSLWLLKSLRVKIFILRMCVGVFIKTIYMHLEVYAHRGNFIAVTWCYEQVGWAREVIAYNIHKVLKRYFAVWYGAEVANNFHIGDVYSSSCHIWICEYLWFVYFFFIIGKLFINFRWLLCITWIYFCLMILSGILIILTVFYLLFVYGWFFLEFFE